MSDSENIVVLEGAELSVAHSEQKSFTVVEKEPDIAVVSLSEQGPPGRDGTSSGDAIEINFAFGDATPAVVVTIPAGKVIFEVGVHITQPFDGVGAALTVGDASDTDRLMKANENEPTLVGSNTTAPAYAYESNTVITLSITPGAGASQGAGVLTIKAQQ